MDRNVLLLGVDGGGTSCRARLCTFAGDILGEGLTGPANLRLGLGRSFAAVNEVAMQCLGQAGLPPGTIGADRRLPRPCRRQRADAACRGAGP